jgi:hypothetical protein
MIADIEPTLSVTPGPRAQTAARTQELQQLLESCRASRDFPQSTAPAEARPSLIISGPDEPRAKSVWAGPMTLRLQWLA